MIEIHIYIDEDWPLERTEIEMRKLGDSVMLICRDLERDGFSVIKHETERS